MFTKKDSILSSKKLYAGFCLVSLFLFACGDVEEGDGQGAARQASQSPVNPPKGAINTIKRDTSGGTLKVHLAIANTGSVSTNYCICSHIRACTSEYDATGYDSDSCPTCNHRYSYSNFDSISSGTTNNYVLDYYSELGALIAAHSGMSFTVGLALYPKLDQNTCQTICNPFINEIKDYYYGDPSPVVWFDGYTTRLDYKTSGDTEVPFHYCGRS